MTTKFLLALQFCKNAAFAIYLLCSENPHFSIDVTDTFSQSGNQKIKTKLLRPVSSFSGLALSH